MLAGQDHTCLPLISWLSGVQVGLFQEELDASEIVPCYRDVQRAMAREGLDDLLVVRDVKFALPVKVVVAEHLLDIESAGIIDAMVLGLLKLRVLLEDLLEVVAVLEVAAHLDGKERHLDVISNPYIGRMLQGEEGVCEL